MMPTLQPDIPGMTVAARYVPTGGGLQVGGDWYDMIPLPSRPDRPGHRGRPGARRAGRGADGAAADRAARLRLRGPPPRRGALPRLPLPGRASTRPSSDGARRATSASRPACTSEVDPATGLLDIARAGHPDPAIRMTRRHDAGPAHRGRAAAGHRPGHRLPDDPVRPGARRDDDAVHRRADRDRRPRPGDRLGAAARHPRGARAGEDARAWRSSPTPWSRPCTGRPRTTPPGRWRTAARTTSPCCCCAARATAAGSAPAAAGPAPVRRTVLTVAQAEPERIAEARRQIRELLHDWADPDQVDSAVLMVSEMVTNVLRAHRRGRAAGRRGHRRAGRAAAARRGRRQQRRAAAPPLPRRTGVVGARSGAAGDAGRGVGRGPARATASRIWFELYEDAGGRGGSGVTATSGPSA